VLLSFNVSKSILHTLSVQCSLTKNSNGTHTNKHDFTTVGGLALLIMNFFGGDSRGGKCARVDVSAECDNICN